MKISLFFCCKASGRKNGVSPCLLLCDLVTGKKKTIVLVRCLYTPARAHASILLLSSVCLQNRDCCPRILLCPKLGKRLLLSLFGSRFMPPSFSSSPDTPPFQTGRRARESPWKGQGFPVLSSSADRDGCVPRSLSSSRPGVLSCLFS